MSNILISHYIKKFLFLIILSKLGRVGGCVTLLFPAAVAAKEGTGEHSCAPSAPSAAAQAAPRGKRLMDAE